MRRAALLAGLIALAACSSSSNQAKPETGDDEKKVLTHERPFIAHFDAIEKRFLPRGEFAPGVESVWAPIHSGLNATLFFVALRNKFPRYVNPEHEETFFVVSGSGTLDLASGKPKPIEGGSIVRIPPRFSHGFTARKGEPLEMILVAAPTVTQNLARLSDDDLPDATGWIYCEDATSEKLLPKLAPYPTPALEKAFLDQTKRSTLQISAVGRARIPDHRHLAHDETVILFAQEGFGFMRIDEIEDPVQPIQIVHIPAGAVHAFEHKANGHGRAISIFTPGYDGRDVQIVEQKEELKAPQGYKQTDARGDWVEPGYHPVGGDFGKPKPREEIKGVGNEGSSR